MLKERREGERGGSEGGRGKRREEAREGGREARKRGEDKGESGGIERGEGENRVRILYYSCWHLTDKYTECFCSQSLLFHTSGGTYI